MRTFFVLPILLLAAAPAFAEDPLSVLAASRTGRIEVFDAATLEPLGAIGVNQPLESVTPSPDGRRLYIAQAEQGTTGSCCGLYSLDLETLRMCLLTTPALFGAPSPDGRFLFTQGKQGVDVFNPTTLSRRTMKAAGQYNLQPSPDGRWVFGITNSPKLSSLDVFDMEVYAMVRRLPIPGGPVTGAWAGDRFYMFSYGADGAGRGSLWSVKPENTPLPPPTTVELPDLHGACHEPVLLMLAGAPDRLYLAEASGFKVDRHTACPDAARDGVYVIQPSTGRVSHIAPSVRVNRMVVSPDGRDLYVIHSAGPSPLSSPGLLRIDARTGRTETIARLESGDWNLALAHIPRAFISRGNVHAALSCSR
jgi:hypothetical protein